MKLLFTGDTQASWHNLDKCDEVMRETLRICKREGIRHVVHTGDLKDQFNPVDIRVPNWAVKTCRTFTKNGISLFVNLGNHDRLGMGDTTDDWFPILQAAGAHTAYEPKIIKLDSGVRLFMVPYSRDNDWLKEQFAAMAKEASPKDSILVFHCEIQGCQHNRLVKSRGDGLVTVGDLHPKKYMFCLGGHIHLHQHLGKNVYYVGSPFAYDWGEANQRKGYVVVDTSARDLRFIPSKQPGLYDPLWPGFKESRPKSWEGSVVRIHVPCDKSVVNLVQFLDQAKAKVERKYPGAEVVVEPEFVDEKPIEFDFETGSDEEMIRAYVDKHCLASLSNEKPAIVAYLKQKLAKVSLLRRANGRLTFLKGYGRNFLSFRKLKVKYNRPGITVVYGKNEDWPGRSNGAGKTSYVQLPVVALTGETLKKGQKHDRWINRRVPKEPAIARLDFLDQANRLCRVVRGRRPGKLELYVKGKDMSHGMGTAKTQESIEILTGLTRDILVNSIYVSQAEVTKILTGTDGERKAIFSQFLNLERFKAAREFISRDMKRSIELMGEIEEACKAYDSKVQQIQRFMSELEGGRNIKELVQELHSLAKQRAKQGKRLASAIKDLKAAEDSADAKREGLQSQINQARAALTKAAGVAEAAERQLSKMAKVKGKCPTCLQPVKADWLTHQRKHLQSAAKDGNSELERIEASLEKLRNKVHGIDKGISDLHHTVSQLKVEIGRLDDKIENRKEELAEVTKRRKLLRQYQKERLSLRKKISITSQASVQLRSSVDFYRFCLDTFSKDGLPAFLAYQLCPKLNKAAEHYSKLFSDGQIHVRFEQADEDIDVKILNAHGGSEVEDQSQGELRLASIIASFALREVTSTCNLLVLDEPGEGLDASNAKRFAEALRQAAKRFGTVFVTTHNPNIMAELSGERRLTIVKRDGISRVAPV